jgi:hypothetical protein
MIAVSVLAILLPSTKSWGQVDTSELNIEKLINEKVAMLKKTKKLVHIDTASKILGEKFLGPKAIKEALGVKLKPGEIPPIPFSKEELLRAKELDQALILHAPADSTGKLLTAENQGVILHKRMSSKEAKSPEALDDKYYYEAEAPKLEWKLVSLQIIPNTASANYLNQLYEIASYLSKKVFRGVVMPVIYQEAVEELKSEGLVIGKILESKPEDAVKKIASLKITKLFRQNASEVIYDHIVVVTAMKKWPYGTGSNFSGYAIWTNNPDLECPSCSADKQRFKGKKGTFISVGVGLGGLFWYSCFSLADDNNQYLAATFSRSF